MLKNNKQKINKKLDPKININKSYLPSSIKVDENGGEECILNSCVMLMVQCVPCMVLIL
jgi:hypothetical protein